jgi:hypothetical protein
LRIRRQCPKRGLARKQDPEGGQTLEGIAHFHSVTVRQIFQAATRIVKWPSVKGNLRIELPLEHKAGQHQVGAKQARRAARGVGYLQATAELDIAPLPQFRSHP